MKERKYEHYNKNSYACLRVRIMTSWQVKRAVSSKLSEIFSWWYSLWVHASIFHFLWRTCLARKILAVERQVNSHVQLDLTNEQLNTFNTSYSHIDSFYAYMNPTRLEMYNVFQLATWSLFRNLHVEGLFVAMNHGQFSDYITNYNWFRRA